MKELSPTQLAKAAKVRLLLTDCDGVLTDTGVFYGESGEVLKRFSIRDGMGVERLRKLCSIETGIITGERSPSVARRAEKLNIEELHLGIKDKLALIDDICARHGIDTEQIGYIGDDTNDLAIMEKVGFTASPGDAMIFAREKADYLCEQKGGHGAFREFAEQIIRAQTSG